MGEVDSNNGVRLTPVSVNPLPQGRLGILSAFLQAVNHTKYHHLVKIPVIWVVLAFSTCLAPANGLYRNGIGAQAMSMGGTDTAWAANPLGAMGDNPAGLGFLNQAEFDLGAVGDVTEGNFSKGNISHGSLNSSAHGLPEAALGVPLGTLPVTVGLSVIPDSALLADWHYMDPPGGLNGTTYGNQEDKSEILLLRTALGAGVKINSQLSFGADVGLVYNENHLKSPYVFQNLQPGSDAPYNGAKTLLDLNTSGFGWNVEAGLLFRATTNLQFGLSYKSATQVNSTGTASGDPSTQFGQPQGTLPFRYDAEVKTKFPQMASIGASWKFYPQWRAALQVDWINWSGAFDNLPVSLSHGNAPVNGVLGSSFKDTIPLNWSDEFVYRAGLEYAVTENLALRLGYAYGQSPVPNSTLTPMTAAITEHTLTAGIGYQWSRYALNLAYQFDFPATQSVGTSGLRSGEYSGSSTTVSIHTLALTASVRF
jgi:long-chain fatty acid transport protein